MSSRSLVVIEVRFQDSAQTGFIGDDLVIQAFPPNRPGQPLDVGILPERLRLGCRENFPNAYQDSYPFCYSIHLELQNFTGKPNEVARL